MQYGAYLAVVPVGYFTWVALRELPDRTRSPVSLAFLIGAVATEVWLGIAAIFGLLHRRLPGRTGPAKCLYLVAVWFAGDGSQNWRRCGRA